MAEADRLPTVTRTFQSIHVLELTPKPGSHNTELMPLLSGKIYVEASEIESYQPLNGGGTALMMQSGRVIYVEEPVERFFYDIKSTPKERETL